MKKYKCVFCGHIYDPAIGDEKNGFPPGTAFEDLPDSWKCPGCGAEKEYYILSHKKHNRVF